MSGKTARTNGLRLESLDQIEFLTLVLDHVSECFVAVNSEGQVVFINAPYCALLGGTAADFVGSHVTKVISPDTKLHLIAQGSPPILGETLYVRGHQLFIKQVPILLNEEIIGAVGMALFTDLSQARNFVNLVETRHLKFNKPSAAWRATYTLQDIVGLDPAIVKLKETIVKASQAEARVLITGETGTGKELVAHSIHSLSNRSTYPFVSVNCATIPKDLVEVDLFGYEGGAFTGARAGGSTGKFELANNGTVFLDEIGDLPIHSQAALLRVIEEGQIVRVGGVRPIKLNVRIICATHHDLEEMVEQGRFREDLFYRLDVIRINTPALRNRNDLSEVSEALLEKITKQVGASAIRLHKCALEQITRHTWPGNVRELRHVLERAVLSTSVDDRFITDVSDFIRVRKRDRKIQDSGDLEGSSLCHQLSQAEAVALQNALIRTRGNKKEAARVLGINRSTLYKKIKSLGD